MNKTIVLWSPLPKRCTCAQAMKYWEKSDAARSEKERVDKIAEEHKLMGEQMARLLHKSGIKKRFATRTFDNFVITKVNKAAFDSARLYADNFEAYAVEGKGIYFEGTYGTGKTHLAVAIALTLMQKGIPVVCKTSTDILADIRNAYDEGTRYSEMDILDIYKNIKLLIIDDLGKEQCTEWSMATIYAILNDRYEAMLPTIITTNYNEDMLIKRLTPRGGDSSNIEAIISRLHECSDVVTMAWEDYRCNENG